MAVNYTPQDVEYLELAVEEAKKSVPVESAYCVGAVLVTDGKVLTTGFSRELPGNTHAEECALLKLDSAPVNLRDATMYTTMEPCSERLSGKPPCTERIISAGVGRVVLGVKEPAHFVQCQGVKLLEAAGVKVVYVPGLEEKCLAPNSHIVS
ncbi:hypothetical protein IWQ60_011258 [Tieghemiomyces parasiticus]|uniref:CMP/dCMP-type deaminase domain-containing protein n=1 Tax=Tieghemiomyces parasiticus TaxID=78921 RepID=A0A9W7ZIZ9_9FUNG|nr:hypothetical protein IWQ60_011258 [Tieghemiomyces parasiticus]